MNAWVWVRIRSWHAAGAQWASKTLCGRPLPNPAEIVDTLPAGKSCETCLRIVARREDT